MKQNNLSIAVTGGIGSGKSEVCHILEEQKLPLISADILGHLALKDHSIKEQLIAEFGNIILTGGIIDRKKLGNLVFDNKKMTDRFNSIVHPFIIRNLKEKLAKQDDPLAVYEIPLLFEAKLEKLFDIILMVWANVQVRKDRISKRSGMPEDKILKIMAAQYPQNLAKKRADYVIINNGSREELQKAVIFVLNKIKKRLEV